MKKILLFIILSLIGLGLHSQTIQPYDTIYDMETYKAYYSDSIKTSSFVIYKLYKPKNNVKRDKLSFKKYRGLSHYNYTNTPYDKGHLVPAADRAESIKSMTTTFYYINAVPQHYKLNRGSWKKYESIIRDLSKKDSLIIICGGCNYSPKDSIVPASCFKVVYSLSTSKPLYSLIFDNTPEAGVHQCDTLLQIFPLLDTKRMFLLHSSYLK